MSKIERLFAPILDIFPSPHRTGAAFALLLAPLALLFALSLRWNRPAPPPLAIAHDHDEWIAQARSLAGHYASLDVARWTPSVSTHQDRTAIRRAASDPSFAAQARYPSPVTITVVLKQENGEGSFNVRFNQAGDPLSWSGSGLPAKASPKSDPDTTARDAVRTLLGTSDPPELVDWTPISGKGKDAGFKGLVQMPAPNPERLPVRVDLHDGIPVSALIGNSDDNNVNGNQSVLEKTTSDLAFCLIGFFLFYSIRLYRRRRREGEIPRGRAILLIAVFGLSGFFFAALNPESIKLGSGLATILSIGWTLLSSLGKSLLFMLGGLFVAAAYASGEGEIREGWPGKLVSFDAMLAGKWFTRTTGISTAIAVTLASWAFLIAALAWQISPARSAVLLDDDLLHLAMGRNVYLRSLAELPLRVSFLIVAGLFMPLAFIHRHGWTGWKRWTVLLLSPLLVDAGLRAFSLEGIGPVITSFGMVAVVGAGFFFGDVLAAVLGAMLYSALTTAAYVAAAVPPLAFTQALFVATVLLGLLPMLVAVWRGHPVDELSVRPTYAHNLAQRLSMRAEVNAARQAQLRLLPVSMPQRADVSVAAYCQPANVVGGDFFDFFTAPDGRLGVFVASGGGLGLASALTIAMAKGFLWSEVKRGESPETALAGLLQALSERVGAAAERTGLLLMIVDAAKGEVKLARRGDFPNVWRMRGPNCTLLEPATLDGNAVRVAEFAWTPGDSLIACTEGLPLLLEDQSSGGQRRWFEVTAQRTLGHPASWIEQDLTSRLGGRKGRRLRGLRRDLTTVVLRNQLA